MAPKGIAVPPGRGRSPARATPPSSARGARSPSAGASPPGSRPGTGPGGSGAVEGRTEDRAKAALAKAAADRQARASLESAARDDKRRRLDALREKAQSDRERLRAARGGQSLSPAPASRLVEEEVNDGADADGGARSSSGPPSLGQHRRSSAAADMTHAAGDADERGIKIAWEGCLHCRWERPREDAVSSWSDFLLGCEYEGEDRSCSAPVADLESLHQPLGWRKVPRVPALTMEAAFDVALGKPLSKFLPKITLAREEGYVLCKWTTSAAVDEADAQVAATSAAVDEADAQIGATSAAVGEADAQVAETKTKKTTKRTVELPFGFSESSVTRQDLNVKVMVHLDEMCSKGIFRLFNQVSLAPNSCQVWWQIGPPTEPFEPESKMDVAIQSLDVDEAPLPDIGIEDFAFLKPHQRKSLQWMVGRELSEEPFLADWHTRRPLEWNLRDSVETCRPAARGEASQRKAMPWERASFNLKQGPAPLSLEYRLENRYDICGGVLADPIGSGKTATCLSAVACMQRMPSPPLLPSGDWRREYLIPLNATLVLCPDSVHHQWAQELTKWPHLQGSVEALLIREIADLHRVKLTDSLPGGVAQIVVVPLSLLESEDYSKIPSAMTSSNWKKQVWSMKQKIARNGGGSGLALECYYWRRVIIDEFHELASTSSGHKGAQRILRFLQSHSRWGVTGTPADLLRNMGAVQCAAKIFHCEFNARRSAYTFCEQYYRSSQVELGLRVQQWLVQVRLGADEVAIYMQILRDLGQAELLPRPWDADQLEILSQMLHQCSHFAAPDAPQEVQNAGSSYEAAQAMLKHKSDLVQRALVRVMAECRHYEGAIMGSEDRWLPPPPRDVARKKYRETCSACRESTCHDCCEEARKRRTPIQDASEGLDRMQHRAQDALRTLEYFLSVWRIANRKAHTKEDCVICLEEHLLDNFTLIQCGHMFCNDCFDSAFAIKKRCPMCRNPVGAKDWARIQPLRTELWKKTESARVAEGGKYSKYGSKLQAIVDAMSEVKASDPEAKVIIFTQWQSLETKIASALTEFEVTYLRLSTCVDLFEKRRTIEAFQDASDGRASVLLLSLDGHASGTNLTCANHVFLVHPMLAATSEQQVAYERQAVGRCARLGQRKTVTVWRFVTAETVEEAVARDSMPAS